MQKESFVNDARIDHFTVVWHVTRPLYESEVLGDLDMLETKN